MENEAKDRGGEGVKSLSPTQEASRQWIVERYGPIKFHHHMVQLEGVFNAAIKIVIAAVPVMGGIAFGVGITEEHATKVLRANLSGEDVRVMRIATVL